MDKEKELLSIGRAAKFLGVSVDTLRRWDASGKLKSAKSPGGHRYYSKEKLENFLSTPESVARNWSESKAPPDLSSNFYCGTQDVFKARLDKLAFTLDDDKETKNLAPLITAVVGEVGNNSFDHNFGNWPDVMGIFFAHDEVRRCVILADRGLGIRKTLSRVRPDLKDDIMALRVAFTEHISGRSPERRGNGLKFVKNIATDNPIGVFLQSGKAVAEISKQEGSLKVRTTDSNTQGTLAKITY